MADLEREPIEPIEREDLEDVEIDEGTTNLVTFRLGSGEYAIDITLLILSKAS